ncbi:MAG: glycine betaine ABC transporter substrate-binding protein [Thermodesulfobacteriota bacterium]|nr:glycine betaine ABC transporter substrate-binding protein [Thermodesulfobacteriota bacterium]
MKKGILFILLIFLIMGCGSKKDKIVIGSKNFTEQVILGEIIALLIENNTDLNVETKFNLGGTFVCFNALKQGEIDLYPEYTGTGLIAILKKEVVSTREEAYRIVKSEFKSKFNLIWLKPFGFNNTYTVTMRKKEADKLSIKKISDLKKYEAVLKPGFNHEFMERLDGYKGLSKKYNLHFKSEPIEIDTGLMYKAVVEKEVDLICGFATDGRIPAFNLVILEDDLNFFPPYYAATLIRAEILAKYPIIAEILNKFGGSISDQEMSKMNYKVDQQGIKAKTVAKEFLTDKRFLIKQ